MRDPVSSSVGTFAVVNPRKRLSPAERQRANHPADDVSLGAHVELLVVKSNPRRGSCAVANAFVRRGAIHDIVTATPCQALTGLSFGRGVRSNRGSWGISWTPASADGATVTYTVTLTDGGGALVATTATTSTSVTLNGLTHGAYYVVVVTANTPASVAGIISPLVISRGNTAT